MRMLALVAVAVLLGATGPAPAGAEPDPVWARQDVAPVDYEGDLAPHGTWYDTPAYGRVWRPVVAPGWRPYQYGQWGWAAPGWTWVSFEPWAWTFHYGRWGWLPPWGWVWRPGFVWGPAWVEWVYSDGWIGWAPLAPWGPLAASHFLYVRDYDFCAPRLHQHVVHHHRVPRHVGDRWRQHVVPTPDRRRVERVSRRKVEYVETHPRAADAPRERSRGRGGRGTPPPGLRTAPPVERPPRPIERSTIRPGRPGRPSPYPDPPAGRRAPPRWIDGDHERRFTPMDAAPVRPDGGRRPRRDTWRTDVAPRVGRPRGGGPPAPSSGAQVVERRERGGPGTRARPETRSRTMPRP